MKFFKVLATFVCAEVWTHVNFRPAGRALVRLLESKIEDARGIAGMGLVKAGERSIPLIHARAEETGEQTPHMEIVLYSINEDTEDAANQEKS